jgi:hypothetical protein
MSWVMNRLRAVLILPAAGAGGLTGVLVGGEGPTVPGDLVQLGALLLICIALCVAGLVYIWHRAGDGAVWGLSREAWSLLVVVAFFIGLGLALSA